jgi:tRNA 2-thiocytidine biosynthesis protein TtcA
MEYPIIPCDLCGSQENLQRKKVKDMLRQWERETPGRVDNVFRALSDVVPSHLMDTNLFGFAGLRASGVADPHGDIAFDDEPCATDSPDNRGAKPISIVPFGDLD